MNSRWRGRGRRRRGSRCPDVSQTAEMCNRGCEGSRTAALRRGLLNILEEALQASEPLLGLRSKVRGNHLAQSPKFLADIIAHERELVERRGKQHRTCRRH